MVIRRCLNSVRRAVNKGVDANLASLWQRDVRGVRAGLAGQDRRASQCRRMARNRSETL